MNILYILNSGKPGGMEKHVLDLVETMIAHGHQVSVWCRAGVVADWYKAQGAKVYIEPITSDIDIKYIIRLTKFLKEQHIQVLHAHEIKAVTKTLIAGFLAGVKVRISHTHTPISEWTTGLFSKGLNLVMQFLVVNLMASTEIALTESRRQIKKREGITPAKLAVIPNCVDDQYICASAEQLAQQNLIYRQKFGIPEKAYVIGNISRISQEKGTDNLLEAFTKAFPKEADVRLFLGGGGHLEDSLRLKYGRDDRVIFTGVFDESDKLGYFSVIDTFVFPTLAEGFGIVLIEALAMRKEVIANSLPVLQEVAPDGVEYIKTADIELLSKSLQEKHRQYSSHGRVENLVGYTQVKSRYTKENFYTNYIKLYENLNAR